VRQFSARNRLGRWGWGGGQHEEVRAEARGLLAALRRWAPDVVWLALHRDHAAAGAAALDAAALSMYSQLSASSAPV